MNQLTPTEYQQHRSSFHILLISTYELGRQPFGLASPATWLRKQGYPVTCVDVAVERLPEEAVQEAAFIGFYVPMHTATRLAVDLLAKVREINEKAHICFYGLYAAMNADYLRKRGADSILGGEFEEGLVDLCQWLSGSNTHTDGEKGNGQVATHSSNSLNRQQFITPQRGDLPPLSQYARLCCENKRSKIAGYVETTRGCKYKCRHCPIVPVYIGRFRVVQKEVVLEDIRQQVEAGAEHITFGDPDFLNGPGHVLPIVKELHQEFPQITYDVTIKVEHLLKHARHLPVLRDTGCTLVTSAVESIDNRILQLLDKGHTREDFIEAVKIFDEVGLALNPTFVTFTPWTTLQGYKELLKLLCEWDLIDNVSPVQLAIRLLIPSGSKLLELPETQQVIGPFNEELLTYEWQHPDPQVDELHQQAMDAVHDGNVQKLPRREVFENVWNYVNELMGESEPLPTPKYRRSRASIPYLNEPWYC